MRLYKYLCVTLLALAFTAPSAFARGGGVAFYLLGVGTFMGQKATEFPGGFPDQDFKAKLRFGGGLGLEFALGKKVGLEIDALYAPRRVETGTATVTSNYLDIPLLLKIWLGPVINFGVGGYFSLCMGDAEVSSASGTQTSACDALSWESSGTPTQESTDFGLTGHLGFNLPLGKTAGLVIQGRYNFGLTDINPGDTSNIKWNGFQAHVGLRFGAMKK